MCDIFDDFPKIENGEAILEKSDGTDEYVPYTSPDDGASISDDSFVDYDGTDESVSPKASDAEIISGDEAEVIADFPDSSEDVDIELKYKRFVDYFLVCGNKKKAAKLAGFSASSDDSLKAQAWKAFKRPEVQVYYKLKKSELAKKSEISFESYMAELVSIATFDIKDAVETEVIPSLTNETIYSVHFKNIEDIPEHARKAVKAIEIAKDGTPKMIFYDKIAALKMIGEIKGFMRPESPDDDDESGIVLIPSVINNSE